MSRHRKIEYFNNEKIVYPKNSFSINYEKYYVQERDWTCSIACIRTILSKFKAEKSEEYYIEKYKLIPGPHYSNNIKDINILKGREAIYGCDYTPEEKDINTIIDLANQGYGISNITINGEQIGYEIDEEGKVILISTIQEWLNKIKM